MVIQQDKIEHWAFGFVFSLFAIINPVFLLFGLAFGLGKEAYDYYTKKRWDCVDLWATCIGVWTAIMFLVVVQ